jgi:hypothetical protein
MKYFRNIFKSKIIGGKQSRVDIASGTYNHRKLPKMCSAYAKTALTALLTQ